jgi:hypothetical protein
LDNPRVGHEVQHTRKGHVMTIQNAQSALIAIRTGASILAAAGLLATAVTVAPRNAAAKPEFAAQTGLPCGQCHSNPAGGGKLKAFGEKFKANGNKVK